MWQWDSGNFGRNLPQVTATSNVVNQANQITMNLRFPGQYYDQETNLHYNYFRTYNPATGRYLESDPIGLQGGVNTYAYVGSNPIKSIDPSGLFEIVFPPGYEPTTFSDAVARAKKEAKYRQMLNSLADTFQQKINRKCVKDKARLQDIFDNWRVYVDPNIDNVMKRKRDFYAKTEYGTQITKFYFGFFYQGIDEPGADFVFAHEFRHLMSENRALTRSGYGIHSSRDSAIEDDADTFAKQCGCED